MEFLNSTIFWIFFTVEVISYFLMRLVQHGYGASKDKVEIVTGLIQLIIVILTFITVNWKGGLTLIISIIILSFPIEFIIYLIYKKMLPDAKCMNFKQFSRKYQSREKSNKSIHSFDNILNTTNDDYDEMLENEAIILDKVKMNSKIIEVLKDYNKTADDLDNIFQLLKIGGVDLAYTVIQSPDLINKYLEMKKNGEPDTVVNFKLAKILGIVP